MWWNHYWLVPWMFVGPVLMIVFIAICITMMFFMMRGMAHGSRRRDAIDILKERLARGEINQAQYEERRRLIEARDRQSRPGRGQLSPCMPLLATRVGL